LEPVVIYLRVYTDVDSDVCKCRCRMSTGFLANVDGNVENMLIYHGKKSPKTPESYIEKMHFHMLIYIYIYTHTHIRTHTHKKAHFPSIFTRKSAKNKGVTPKNVTVDWKDLQMSNICRCRWFLQMSTRYGRHLCAPLNLAKLLSGGVRGGRAPVPSSQYHKYGVCCFVVFNRYWGIVTVPGFSRASQGGRTDNSKSHISLFALSSLK